MNVFGARASFVSDAESFRAQESIFALLNLLLIAALALINTAYAPAFGVLAVFAAGFLLEGAELAWLILRTAPLSQTEIRILRWWAITLNMGLAAILALITFEEQSQYFVLMLVPVLEAAFTLNLPGALGVFAVADMINFVGTLWDPSMNEYVEATTISLIYSGGGILVWLLVNNLRDREAELARNLDELGRTRERLLAEEKLAAVGRFASAIAHEIRNPVAMIASSLATAARAARDETERGEMFAIAQAEAQRLERLTSEFLNYARPRPVQPIRTNLADTLNYVASVARARAAERGVEIVVEADRALEADLDAAQIQQALLNLVLNATDACDGNDLVTLSARQGMDGIVRLEVSDPTGPIPAATVERMFEPFFTTKTGGTGLGLAISRSIARAHGGDLLLSVNQPGRVCFAMEIPARAHAGASGQAHDEQNTGGR